MQLYICAVGKNLLNFTNCFKYVCTYRLRTLRTKYPQRVLRGYIFWDHWEETPVRPNRRGIASTLTL